MFWCFAAIDSLAGLCLSSTHWDPSRDSKHVRYLSPQRNEALWSIKSQLTEARGPILRCAPATAWSGCDTNHTSSRALVMTFHGESIKVWMVENNDSASIEFPQIVLGGCSLGRAWIALLAFRLSSCNGDRETSTSAQLSIRGRG